MLRADFFRYQRSGLDAVAAIDNRKRIDSQDMNLSHGNVSFPDSWVNTNRTVRRTSNAFIAGMRD
jgi:hypothetical protein